MTLLSEIIIENNNQVFHLTKVFIQFKTHNVMKNLHPFYIIFVFQSLVDNVLFTSCLL